MRLELIIGSMYSGKTSELIRRIKRHQSIHQRVLVINSCLDDRYSGDGAIITHDNGSYECVKVKTLSEIGRTVIDEVDVIAIDEGQFFSDLVEYTLKYCEEYKKTVIVAGLISDFQRKRFGSILDLTHYADCITHQTALCTQCKDNTPGIFTKKICTSEQQIDVGSTGKYTALCRACYLK